MLTIMQGEETYRARDTREPGHFWADNEIVPYIPVIGATGFALYMLLCYHARNNTGRSWPAVSTLGDELGVSKSVARKYLGILEAAGLILVTPHTIDTPNGKKRYETYTYTLLHIKDGVGKNLTQGGSENYPGVGKNFTPNNTKNNNTNGTIENHSMSDASKEAPTAGAVDTSKTEADHIDDTGDMVATSEAKETPTLTIPATSMTLLDELQALLPDPLPIGVPALTKLHECKRWVSGLTLPVGEIIPAAIGRLLTVKPDELGPQDAFNVLQVVQADAREARVAVKPPLEPLPEFKGLQWFNVAGDNHHVHLGKPTPTGTRIKSICGCQVYAPEPTNATNRGHRQPHQDCLRIAIEMVSNPDGLHPIFERDEFGRKQGTRHLGKTPGSVRTLCGKSSQRSLSTELGFYYTGREHKQMTVDDYRDCPVCQHAAEQQAAKVAEAKRPKVNQCLIDAVATHIQQFARPELANAYTGVLAGDISQVWKKYHNIEGKLTAEQYQKMAASIPVFIRVFKADCVDCNIPTTRGSVSNNYTRLLPKILERMNPQPRLIAVEPDDYVAPGPAR